MAAKIVVERSRTRQPSSSRSISTADDRPIFSSVSGPSGSPATANEYSGSSEEDWDSLDEADYAVHRSRPPTSNRNRVEVQVRPVEVRPVAERRESSRISQQRVQVPEAPEAPTRRPSSRQSRRDYQKPRDSAEHLDRRQQYDPEPRRRRRSSDHSEGMAPYDDRRSYGLGHYGPRQAPQQWGYQSSSADSYGSYNPLANAMPPPGSQIIPYQQYAPPQQQYSQQPYYAPNPLISPYAQPNPLSPLLSAAGGYFGQIPQPAMPMMPYPYYPYAMQPPLATPRSEAEDDRFQKLQALILTQENARLAREKERDTKQEADKKVALAKAAKEAADKAAAEAIEDATKKAKAEAEAVAEKKAKEAKAVHEKALGEAKAAEEAAKAEAKKNKPPDDATRAPIKFKDAVGRKFSFPWRICKTWKGMEELIQQAFLHVDGIGKHVQQGHYDLIGPNGEIILPQVWESTVEPDWQITMHLWPIEDSKKKEEEKKSAEVVIPGSHHSHSGHREIVGYDIWGRKKTKKRSKSMSGGVVVVPAPPPPVHSASYSAAPSAAASDAEVPPPPPPAPAPPPAVVLTPSVALLESGAVASVSVVKEKKKPVQQVPPLAAWMAGSMGMRAKRR